jgi:4-carboxymuconolactone decarboxylase
MQKLPETFHEFIKQHPQIAAAHERLSDECQKAGPLNERERALVKLGIAAGAHMEGSVHSQVRKALDVGLEPNEIRHAVMLGVTTIGFPRMMASLSWAEDILRKQDIKK